MKDLELEKEKWRLHAEALEKTCRDLLVVANTYERQFIQQNICGVRCPDVKEPECD